MSDTTTARLPTRAELGAWRSFLRAHARITRCLETELVAEQRLSLAAYDVLVQLAEAPRHRMRMTDLADAVLLSRSGVTRLVDRLERAGLVSRLRSDEDGRGVVAVLSERGGQRLQVATNTHWSGVVRHFAAVISPEELDLLGGLCGRLAEGEMPQPPLRVQD